jgi:hypothetical protein
MSSGKALLKVAIASLLGILPVIIIFCCNNFCGVCILFYLSVTTMLLPCAAQRNIPSLLAIGMSRVLSEILFAVNHTGKLHQFPFISAAVGTSYNRKVKVLSTTQAIGTF